MKKRHQAEEIIRILRDVDSSDVKSEAIKRHGISQQTYYAWKRKHGGMQVDKAKRLRFDLEGPYSEICCAQLVASKKIDQRQSKGGLRLLLNGDFWVRLFQIEKMY